MFVRLKASLGLQKIGIRPLSNRMAKGAYPYLHARIITYIYVQRVSFFTFVSRYSLKTLIITVRRKYFFQRPVNISRWSSYCLANFCSGINFLLAARRLPCRLVIVLVNPVSECSREETFAYSEKIFFQSREFYKTIYSYNLFLNCKNLPSWNIRYGGFVPKYCNLVKNATTI